MILISLIRKYLIKLLIKSEQICVLIQAWLLYKIRAILQRVKSIVVRAPITIQAHFLRVWINIFFRYSFWWLSFIYFLFVLGSAVICGFWGRGGSGIESATLFLTAGAISAGTLAIISSFSILLIQNASQQTSAGLYKIMVRDRIQALGSWAIIIITLFLFVGAFSVESIPAIDRWTKAIIISLTGTVFWILFSMLYRLRQRINPFAGISRIQKEMLREIKRFDSMLERLAKYVTAHPTFDKETPKSVVRAGILNRLDSRRDIINTWFSHLFDYHGKLSDNHESGAAKAVLNVIHMGLKSYLHMVEDASVTYVEDFLAKSSNSQAFLGFSLSKLAGAARQSMIEQDEVQIRQIVEVLQDLTLQSSNIKYGTTSTNENPIFEQFRFYLDRVTEEAVQLKSLEGLHCLVLAHKHVATTAIQKGIPFNLNATYKSLTNIGIQSLKVDGYQSIWSGVLRAYGSLLKTTITNNDHNLRIELESILENIIQLLELSSLAMNVRQFNDILSYGRSVNELFSDLRQGVLYAIEREKKEKKDNKQYTGSPVVILKELYLPLRLLAKQIRLTDKTLVINISKLSAELSCIAMDMASDPRWKNQRQALQKEAQAYMYIPTWHIPKEGKMDKDAGVNDVVEAVAKVGIKAIESNYDAIAKEVIVELDRIATAMLEREGGTTYGLTEPRIMAKACYVGIIALKQGKQKIVDGLKERIDEFDKRYEKKWFPTSDHYRATSIQPDQLFKEVVRLRDNKLRPSYTNRVMTSPFASGQVLKLISIDNIDAFTSEVWQKQAGEKQFVPPV